MSRKGVTTKRVKTVQTALSRISAQPRSPAGRETLVSRSAKPSVRLKSRPKFKPPADAITTREHCPAVGRATTTPRHAARPHVPPRQWRRPSREATSRVRPRTSANLHPSDHSGRPRIHPATTVPIDPTTATTRSSGRSSRPTVRTPRSTRSPF
ncbi:unnamed protein product [Microthlaspi erraticum]|uniref:Uncharacterized protein n=1 Tax=Microthlaspi erraticum TaxID=1685480 RepID=A0A6D2HTJ6_9BRAS|nr:unnamed protein product [Microthlaspi erraticum]